MTDSKQTCGNCAHQRLSVMDNAVTCSLHRGNYTNDANGCLSGGRSSGSQWKPITKKTDKQTDELTREEIQEYCRKNYQRPMTDVELKAAVYGAHIQAQLAKSQDVCPWCLGIGFTMSLLPDMPKETTCSKCQGTGKRQDPELRKALIAWFHEGLTIKTLLRRGLGNETPAEREEWANNCADQIIALLPERITFPDAETAVKWLQSNEEAIRKNERKNIIRILQRKHLKTNRLLLDRQWLYRELDPTGEIRKDLSNCLALCRLPQGSSPEG